jgi:hypothetical protein
MRAVHRQIMNAFLLFALLAAAVALCVWCEPKHEPTQVINCTPYRGVK